MSLANAILLAAVTGAASAAVAFVVTVWLDDREIAVWVAHTETERQQRIECQIRHDRDNDEHGARIRMLETENDLLHAELETIKHGHYRAPATMAPRVVA